MSGSFFAVFLLTMFIATITPGPSMLLALNHGISFGWRRSLATAWGNVAATALQCLVSFAGLGFILAKAAWVFTAIRWAGAAYLVYLGCRLLFGPVEMVAPGAAPASRPEGRATAWERKGGWGWRWRGLQPAEGGAAERAMPRRSLFREAFVVTASNPKAVFFFSSLFPQFFADGQLTPGKATVLCGSTLATTFGCMMLYATAGERIQGLFRRERFRAIFQRGVGAMLVGFGAGLALERK